MKRGSSLSRGSGGQLVDSLHIAWGREGRGDEEEEGEGGG